MDSSPHSPKLIWLPLLLSLLLASCSDSETTAQQPIQTEPVSTAPARGDRLVDASIGDASNLIPMIAGDASSHAIAGQHYLSLLKHDRNLDLTGQLAESWEISDDQLSITFRLRDNLTWTDGEPLTSADCAFTLALIQDQHTQSAYKSDYAKVIRFETPDRLTFRVFYSESYSPALSDLWAACRELGDIR